MKWLLLFLCFVGAAAYALISSVFPAVAETAPASGAQTGSNAMIEEWGANGSASQTGLSARTSGKALRAPNGQQDTTSSETPTEFEHTVSTKPKYRRVQNPGRDRQVDTGDEGLCRQRRAIHLESIDWPAGL